MLLNAEFWGLRRYILKYNNANFESNNENCCVELRNFLGVGTI